MCMYTKKKRKKKKEGKKTHNLEMHRRSPKRSKPQIPILANSIGQALDVGGPALLDFSDRPVHGWNGR